MVREDKTAWKSNYFVKIIVSEKNTTSNTINFFICPKKQGHARPC
jgi:hypothetical protein